MTNITKQIIITSVVLLLVITLFEFSNIDIWLQDYFYHAELHQWLLNKEAKIPKLIFYDGIKRLIILSVIVVLIGSLLFRKSSLVQEYREGIFILVLAAIFVPLLIGALKATTNIPCPNDLKHYGGTYPHITLLTSYPQNFVQTENIRCYPAGHASGGFALLSLVFLFKTRRNKVIAAAFALSIGWSMGLYKMLIGDHFLSHTIVTMLLAWLTILVVVKGVYTFSSK